jgi:hypothetical protein
MKRYVPTATKWAFCLLVTAAVVYLNVRRGAL